MIDQFSKAVRHLETIRETQVSTVVSDLLAESNLGDRERRFHAHIRSAIEEGDRITENLSDFAFGVPPFWKNYDPQRFRDERDSEKGPLAVHLPGSVMKFEARIAAHEIKYTILGKNKVPERSFHGPLIWYSLGYYPTLPKRAKVMIRLSGNTSRMLGAVLPR